jgi:predicted metal-dependent peptidase
MQTVIDDPQTNMLSQVLQWACSPRGGNNFWGRVMNGCGRRETPGLGTAGVTLTRDGKYLLLWDPDFFESVSVPTRIVVIVHEAAHLALSHLERAIAFRSRHNENQYILKQLHQLLNIAQDLTVNDLAVRPLAATKGFEGSADQLLFPEKLPYSFPTGLSAEEYFALLLKKCKEDGYDPSKQETDEDGNALDIEIGVAIPQDGSNQKESSSPRQDKSPKNVAPDWLKDTRQNTMPLHIDWQQIMDSMTDSEVERLRNSAKSEIKHIVRKAVEQTVKGRGTVPGEIKAYIDTLLAEPTVPWQEILHNLLRSAISSKLAESTAWPHMGLLAVSDAQCLEPFPGMQKDFEFFVSVAVDTSGSVSNEDFIDFMTEIKGLLKAHTSVTARVMFYDAAIQREFTLSPEDEIEYHCTRYGCGGTDFCPPFKRLLGVDTDEDWMPDAEKITGQVPRSDLFIHLTDGYAPVHSSEGGPMPEYIPPCPCIWVLTESGKEDPHMHGTVVHIDQGG